jgi:hypothetical protein
MNNFWNKYKMTIEGLNIDKYGNKKWYNSKGDLHREDGPAIEFLLGARQWYINGKLHRLDGPATEWVNGDQEWYKDGLYHRENGPAIIHKHVKEWFINGVRHRLDGPAIIYNDVYQMWFIDGQNISNEEFLRIVNLKVCL